jgi:nucleoside-diphosphate-sugar epimerase
MKTFVTGANGFIGSNLVKCLLSRGHEVKGLVLHGTDIKSIENTGCEIIYGDIRRVSEFEKHLEGVDVVFHLAAKVSDWGKWKDFYEINVEGSKSLVESCVRKGVRKFVFISSLAVHKPRGYENGDESAPRDNRNFPYALSKIMVEEFLEECHEKGRIETTIIRPGVFPFGPEDMTSFYKIARAMEKGLFGYVNGGKALLCTAYVENLVYGISLAGEKNEANGKVYVIGDNVKIRWRELTEIFAKHLNVPPPKISLPYFLAKGLAMLMEGLYKTFSIDSPPPLTNYRVSLIAKDFFFSSERAMKELGYLPQVSIEEGVKRTVEWFVKKKSPKHPDKALKDKWI